MTVLDVLARVEAESPEAADVLAHFTLYEALCDEADRVSPHFEREVREHVGKRTGEARRALLRSYVAKRAAGEPVDGYLERAAQLTAVEVVVSKAPQDDPNTPWWDARGAGGQFVSGTGRGRVGRVMDFVLNRDDSLRSQGEKVGDRWTPRDGSRPSRYDRMGVIGNGLIAGAAHTGRPELAMAGTAVRVASELGPEAERVLGPGMKRTAYRYRGTERRPNARMQGEAAAVAGNARAAASGKVTASGDTAWDLIESRYHQRGQVAPKDAALGRWLASPQGKRMTPDQLRLAASGDYAALQLVDQIPNLEMARISLAAGKMPPSVGLMIDRDGDIVSEAMGFNGDHYLPFDLKNLKRLHGGQYVRTRTTGGPTDEDVYTGLLTGARQVQVVSNSGVFTIEFDPDLRGGRRYSDKARQMVDRYARIVAEIGSGTLMAQDIPPARKAELRQKALTRANNDPEEARRIYNELQTQERTKQTFATMDDDELAEEATRRAREEIGSTGGDQAIARRAGEIQTELRNVQRDAQARAYQLDGRGYAAAMTALKQEFPYFIRTARYEPLDEFLTELKQPQDPDKPRPGRKTVADIGYTARGGLTPSNPRRTPPKEEPKQQGGQGGQGQQNGAAPRTPTGGAGAQPRQGSRSPWVEEGTRPLSEAIKNAETGFVRKLGMALGPILGARKSPALADVMGEPIGNNNEQLALENDEANWAAWMSSKGDGPAQARYILGSSDPRHLQQAAAFVRLVHDNVPPEEQQRLKTKEALEALETADLIQAPAVKATGDPALTPPTRNRPPAFDEVVELGDRPANYTAYLNVHDDVKAEALRLEGQDDEATATQVADQIERYQALSRWAADGFPDDSPRNFGKEDREEAEEIKAMGTSSPAYKRLAATQKAWALLRQRKALYGLEGQTPPPLAGGGADPKERTAKRLTFVHPPGSPLAVALSKRLRSR